MHKLDEILREIKSRKRKTVVLAGAHDVEGLKALKRAMEENLVDAILVGPKEGENNARELKLEAEYIKVEDPEKIADLAVKLVREGKARILMKGLIKTSVLLKAVLDKETGLRTGEVLSHVAVVEAPALDRLILVTDGGMIIKPTLEQKVSIINNAVKVAKMIGIEMPRVACIAAVETVNPDMPETMEAAILAKMNQRGQIKDCIVDGPLGLDNAINMMAAKVKEVEGEVAGRADILLVPDIHSGNFLGKAAVYLAGGRIAGVVVGARAPIVIVSRADSADSKLCSLGLASLLA